MKLTLAATLIPLALASPTYPTGPNPKPAPGLADLAKKAGLKYFGTAIDNVVLDNTQYTSIAFNASEFNQVTPANGQKWESTEPTRGIFNFTLGDQIVTPSKKAHQLRRCHNFVWHQQLPAWLTSQKWSKAELLSILETHIAHLARHYYTDCYAWDVVNEAFNDNGTLRSSIWLDTLGPSYIATAFRFARKHTAPGTKLYYNDYNIETVNNKSLAAQTLVKTLLAEGVKIDGVGLQSHFITGASPSYTQLRDAQRLFTGLGLETALTELDVRTTLPDTDASRATQATNYADSVRACVDEERCVGVTVWDFWDPVSWVPATFPGQGDADLYDGNFTRKAAYYKVAEVLGAAAAK